MTITKTEVTFTVTEDHIRNGEKDSPNRCAGANAFYDSNPSASYVRFGREQLSFRWQGSRYRVEQPARVRALIEANDNGSRDVSLAGRYKVSLREAVVDPIIETRHRKTKVSKPKIRAAVYRPRPTGRPNR